MVRHLWWSILFLQRLSSCSPSRSWTRHVLARTPLFSMTDQRTGFFILETSVLWTLIFVSSSICTYEGWSNDIMGKLAKEGADSSLSITGAINVKSNVMDGMCSVHLQPKLNMYTIVLCERTHRRFSSTCEHNIEIHLENETGCVASGQGPMAAFLITVMNLWEV